MQNQNIKRLRIEAYEDEIASLLEENSQLESQLRLVTENLNFEAQNKDHWRNSTQAARFDLRVLIFNTSSLIFLRRRELEKQQESNRTLLMRNLEVEEMFQDQTSSCMKVLGDVLTIVWSLSNRFVWTTKLDLLKMIVSSSDSLKFLVRGGHGQVENFFQLSTKILAQFLEKDKRLRLKLLRN